ncbi:hypothetical protein MPER_16318, partial [Moniliophthora perniciosa FA553]
MGPRTLCNACGLVWAKLVKKREREGLGAPVPVGRGKKNTTGALGARFSGGDKMDVDGDQDHDELESGSESG